MSPPGATERLAEGIQKMSLRGCMTKESSAQRLEVLRDSMRKSIQFVRPLNEGVKKEFRRDSILAAPMRIFYASETSRDEAFEMMLDVSEMMAYLARDAKTIMTSADSTPEQQDEVVEYLLWDGIDLSVTKIQGVRCYGIEVCEGIFWEAYVMTQDSGSELFDGSGHGSRRGSDASRRGSDPSKRGSDASHESAHQFENFKMIRTVQSDTRKKVVVWQMDTKAPMRPGKSSREKLLVLAEVVPRRRGSHSFALHRGCHVQLIQFVCLSTAKLTFLSSYLSIRLNSSNRRNFGDCY